MVRDCDPLVTVSTSGWLGSTAKFVRLARTISPRVVVGFQGGVWNAAGDYPNVRRSDAHAWSEVWVDGTHVPVALACPARGW